jgi:Tfp pilus assembly major pilin PilA
MALISCPECNADISEQALQCPQCGYVQQAQASSPAPATAAQATAASDDELLDAAIGPVNKSFYRPKFDRFAAGQGSVSWNWPAFFVTIFWMLYRRMYAYALLVWLVLPIVFVIVAVIIGGISGDPGVYAGTYYLLWMVTGFVIIPMFANRLYYRHATNKIARARALFNNEEDQLREVYRTGGTGGAGIIVAVIFGGIMLVGILAAIAVPAYQDYTIRAQVSEGLHLSGGAKAAVTEYMHNNREFPLDNNAAGLMPANQIAGKYTGSVAVDEGQIVVTYGNSAHAAIIGQTLYLVPDVSEYPNVSWTCVSQDLANKWLPAACRN